jgi:hypothetical protein
MTVVTGTGPAQMKELAVKLRAADKVQKAALRKRFRAIAAPTVRAVRASALSQPSRTGAGTLRADVAKTVGSSVGITKNGVRLDIVSSGSKMPAGEGNLPVYMDSPKGWMHPVFGRPEAEVLAHMTAAVQKGFHSGRAHGRGWVWVRQHGKPQWFEAPIGPAARDAQAAAQQAMEDTARFLS